MQYFLIIVFPSIHSPDELPADGTERRLFEEGGEKLVVFDEVDLGLFDGSSSSIQC